VPTGKALKVLLFHCFPGTLGLGVVVIPADALIELIEYSVRLDDSGAGLLVRAGSIQVNVAHFDVGKRLGFCAPEIEAGGSGDGRRAVHGGMDDGVVGIDPETQRDGFPSIRRCGGDHHCAAVGDEFLTEGGARSEQGRGQADTNQPDFGKAAVVFPRIGFANVE